MEDPCKEIDELPPSLSRRERSASICKILDPFEREMEKARSFSDEEFDRIINLLVHQKMLNSSAYAHFLISLSLEKHKFNERQWRTVLDCINQAEHKATRKMVKFALNDFAARYK